MTLVNKNYIGILLIGLAIVIFWVFGMAMWDRISLLNMAVDERGDILTSRKEIIAKIEALNKQSKERAADVSKLSTVVPDTKSSAELVSTLETMSQQTGLQLIELTMSDSSKQKIKDDLQNVFIELGLMGSYSSLTNFLGLLEKNVRLLDVTEMSASQVLAGGLLNFRIKASAYYLKIN